MTRNLEELKMIDTANRNLMSGVCTRTGEYVVECSKGNFRITHVSSAACKRLAFEEFTFHYHRGKYNET